MIEVLLYGGISDEVEYGCTEMLNDLGLPYKKVVDLRSLKCKGNLHHVLILPETSSIDEDDIQTIRNSNCPFIMSGHVSQELTNDIKCRVAGTKGENPPRISGILKVSKMDPVPIFYEFPILEFLGHKHLRIGEIESEHGEYVSVLIGERNNRPWAIISPQIFRSAAYLLSGSEATLPQEAQKALGLMDDYGRISGDKSEIYKKGFLETPIVNTYERLLFRILMRFSAIMDVPLVHKWFHPRNCDMVMCLTHDVDHAISVEEGLDAIANLRAGKVINGLAKVILASTALVSNVLPKLRIRKSRDSLRLLPRRLTRKLMLYNSVWNFGEYIEIERRYGATSSFYFLTNLTDEDSDYDFQNPLIKEVTKFIERSGCEVGLHGSFNSCNDKTRIIEEKKSLERSLGAEVVGVRQHFLRIVVPDTWKNQESAGFSYDTTFGYADEMGFRAGTCLPYYPWNSKEKRKLAMLEIPLVIMDRTLFWKRYLALTSDQAFQNCRKLVDVTHKYNGVVTLLWHPHGTLMNRKKNQSWCDPYKRILAYSSRYAPWYTNGKGLAEWWNLRKLVFFDEASLSESKLRFCLNSPQRYEGFSVRIYVPRNSDRVKLFVNRKELSEKSIVKNRRFSLLSFDIVEGRNEVEISL